MTTTEILAEIRDRQGRDVLSDGKRLLGLFDDYSQGKLRPQSNALRVLVSCGGNQRIASLRSAPALQQRTELHRLVQEMVTEYNMQETSARDICGAIWEAFCGTEVPLNQLAEPIPAQSRTLTPERAAEMPKPRSETASRPEPRETEPVRLTPPASRTPDTPPRHAPEPQKEKLPEPTPQKRVIDKSTRILLILGVMGVVGFLMMAAMTPLSLAQGKKVSGYEWVLFLVLILLAALTGWRCRRLWKEAIKPAYTTKARNIYSAAAALFYCGVLFVSILFPLLTSDGMSGAMLCYTVLTALLAAAGAVFQATWHKAFWEVAPPKLEGKWVAAYLVLGIGAAIAVTLVFGLSLLVPEILSNATGKGILIFLWTALQIGLVVWALRFMKANGSLLGPETKKWLAMLCGVGTVLLSLWGGYINLTFEEGIRPGQVAAMLLLLVLTVRRMVWIQKNGFAFSNISKISRNYSLTVGFLSAFFVWGMFIALPIFVLEIFQGEGLETIILFILFYALCGFEALWHVSKAAEL